MSQTPSGENAAPQRPAHIQPEYVVDFDIYNPPGLGNDVFMAWKMLQDSSRKKGLNFVWTPHNGGHWIVTQGKMIEAVQKEWHIFSYELLTIPAHHTRALPLEVPPEKHAALRALISPLFTPATLKNSETLVRSLAAEMAEKLLPIGHCEFMTEFSQIVPISVFLNLMKLPLDDREMLLSLSEKRVRSTTADEREEAKTQVLEYLKMTIDERRSNPGNDFISRIIHGEVDGKPLSDDDLQNMLSTLMFGGLHTVMAMTGFIIRFLAGHPDHRQRMIKEGITNQMVNELIRPHGVSNTARVIKQNIVYEGVRFCEGDRIVVPGSLVGLDDQIFPDPFRVDFDRHNAGQHAAFGNSPHRCAGANLARMEIKVILEEWLKRIPDFSIDPVKKVIVRSGGLFDIPFLPLVWDVK